MANGNKKIAIGAAIALVVGAATVYKVKGCNHQTAAEAPAQDQSSEPTTADAPSESQE